MTSQSPRIYLYKITFEEVPYYYYGVHKEKKFGEKYWGKPITHKWVWDFYTPKKQILEIFPYTDEGWIEAQEVETRLIKPFFNDDKWCLNENCGGKISLKILRETGKKIYENGKGIHSLTKEQRIENGKKAGNKNVETGHIIELGKKWGNIFKEEKLGIFGLTKEEKSEAGKKGSAKNKENKVGIFSMSKEELSLAGKRSYEVRKQTGKDNLSKISREERKEIAAKTCSQKWMCLETGHISNSGGLSKYQIARGIDTSKRKRIE